MGDDALSATSPLNDNTAEFILNSLGIIHKLSSDTNHSIEASFNFSINMTEDERIDKLISEIREAVHVEVIAYFVCFVIGTCSNLWAFYKLSLRVNKNRVNYLIRHLTFADLMVMFFAILPELLWRITIRWEGGQLLCKLLNVVKAYTLYLSSNIIVCVSLDRYYAFVRPLGHINYEDRNCQFLLVAHLMSFLFSLPQVILIV